MTMCSSWNTRQPVRRTVQVIAVEVKHGLRHICCSTSRHLVFPRLEGRSKSDDKLASSLHSRRVYRRHYMRYIDPSFRPNPLNQSQDMDDLPSIASEGTHCEIDG